jgi:SAM-dependent methyltransferase
MQTQSRNTTAKPAAARCPVCRTEGRLYFRHPVCGIYRCHACADLFSDYHPPDDHVASVYDDSYFDGGGAGYPGYHHDRDLLTETGRRYGRLVAEHLTAGAVLDVGAAAGYILRGYHEAGWRGRGIEPNPRMAAAALESGLHVEVGTLEDFDTDERFDLISLIQVAAHFRDIPKAFANAARLTRPGGLILVETWNADSLTARFWGRRWHEFSPPSVLHWFTPASLARLCGRHGFREIVRGRPRKRISGAHARSLLRHASAGTGPASLLRHAAPLIPTGLVIPYPAEDLFWGLYRKE